MLSFCKEVEDESASKMFDGAHFHCNDWSGGRLDANFCALREFCANHLEPSRQAKRIKQDQDLDSITMGGAKEKMG
jgi:hypothetical protein